MRTLPDARLALAASFVRPQTVFADIGSDHAYLTCYLLATGRIRQAVVTDVREGPLLRAEKHLAEAGLLSRVRLLRTDGLHGLDTAGLQDIAICGMGGELIVRILAPAVFLRDPQIRLILQPMTHAGDLRLFLAANGFAVLDEKYAEASGRIYCCLCACYDGIVRRLNEAEAAFGRMPDVQDTGQLALFRTMLTRQAAVLRRRIAGLSGSGRDASASEQLLQLCLHILNQTGDSYDCKATV